MMRQLLSAARHLGVTVVRFFEAPNSVDARTDSPPPRVREGIVALIALASSLLLAAAAIALCITNLHTQLRARLAVADTTLSALMTRVEQELDTLTAADAAELDCSEHRQRVLARASFGSMLVREFYFARDGMSMACSALGEVSQQWQFAEPRSALQVTPMETIRSGIAVARRHAGHDTVAIIEPRQLLDRLPTPSIGERIWLRTIDGRTLGVIASGASATMDARPSLTSEKWPLMLVGELRWIALRDALPPYLLIALLLALLATAAIVALTNRALARASSRPARLRFALRKRRFMPVLQPIVNASTGRCEGVEVLIRMRHYTRGLVAPAEFIEYAEQSGLIAPMSELLMRQTCESCAEIALRFPELYFSFNIAPIQCYSPGFAQTLVEIFDGDPIAPSRVVLELTERGLADDVVRSKLRELSMLGFNLALDDFGTGQSSLALLADMRPNKLKIDRAFVQHVRADHSDYPILDAIIALAQRLEIATVVEGVESEAQSNYVVSKGVNALQGYLFAPPLTPPDFDAWMMRHSPLATEQVNAIPLSGSSISLPQLIAELRSQRAQIERTHWYKLRRYTACFLGEELVSWMATRYALSRLEAVKLGRRLLARGDLTHVHEEHDFEDAALFYRIAGFGDREDVHALDTVPRATEESLLMQLRGRDGVAPGVRYAGALRFEDAVSGAQVVDTLMRRAGLDRRSARLVGSKLMQAGFLRHAFDTHGFEDSAKHMYHLAAQ